FYAIDRATGEPVWWYRVEHPESRKTAGFVSSPATDGKRVYVGGLDGMVYAFPTGVEKPR
ncbi:MAG: PQQ-binding-like beta-propeller repeat protein, partial [Gammaproteobacteria bacterium]